MKFNAVTKGKISYFDSKANTLFDCLIFVGLIEKNSKTKNAEILQKILLVCKNFQSIFSRVNINPVTFKNQFCRINAERIRKDLNLISNKLETNLDFSSDSRKINVNFKISILDDMKFYADKELESIFKLLCENALIHHN